MKKFLTLALALAMVLSLAACGSSKTEPAATDPSATTSTEKTETPAKNVTLKMGHKMAEDSLDGQAFQKFADLANEYSNGTVTVEVYPSSQLGDGSAQVNNVLLGSQDIYAESYSEWAGVTPLADVGGSVPFLFTTEEDYFELVRGDFGAEQLAALEAGGVVSLATDRNFLRPYRVLCTTDKKIESLSDLKGIRLRTWENASYMTCWDNLGTQPIVIGWTDTYLALQQGTADAVTSPSTQVEMMGFYEVAPYVGKFNEFPQEIALCMNKAKFDSLSAEQQQALMDAANDAGEYYQSILEGELEASFARMEAAGATIYDIDTSTWRDALSETYKSIEAAGNLPAGLCASLGIN